MDTQLPIKIVLIVVLAVAVAMIIFPGRGARGQAVQRLFWLLGLLVGVVAIIFPALTSVVASWLGIGRGTDLLLYLLIVFVIAFTVTNAVRNRKTDRTITVLARKIALMEAELRKTGTLRIAATEAHGKETVFDATGPIDLPDFGETPRD